MEHAVHLAAGHFIKGVAPTSGQALLHKVKDAFKGADMDDMEEYDGDMEENGGDDELPDLVFEVGDAVGKALALVTQARL